jgi:hypothetical protein
LSKNNNNNKNNNNTAPQDHCQSLWLLAKAKAQQQHQQSHQQHQQSCQKRINNQPAGVTAKTAIVERPASNDGAFHSGFCQPRQRFQLHDDGHNKRSSNKTTIAEQAKLPEYKSTNGFS